MDILSSFLGYRDFLTDQEIKKYIMNSKNHSSDENDDEIQSMLIFKTSKQKTWILTSSIRLYCLLDDIRKDKPLITWSIPKKEIVEDGELILDIRVRNKRDKKHTGLIDFGEKHRWWLYTKKLLGDDNEAGEKIKSFVKETLS